MTWRSLRKHFASQCVMSAGGVAEAVREKRHHRFEDPWVEWSRCVVIKIDHLSAATEKING